MHGNNTHTENEISSEISTFNNISINKIDDVCNKNAKSVSENYIKFEVPKTK